MSQYSEREALTLWFFVFCLTDVFFAWHPRESERQAPHPISEMTHDIYIYTYTYTHKHTPHTYIYTHTTYNTRRYADTKEHRFFSMWCGYRCVFLVLSRQSSLSKESTDHFSACPRRHFFSPCANKNINNTYVSRVAGSARKRGIPGGRSTNFSIGNRIARSLARSLAFAARVGVDEDEEKEEEEEEEEEGGRARTGRHEKRLKNAGYADCGNNSR